jgi:hypothetical protein
VTRATTAPLQRTAAPPHLETVGRKKKNQCKKYTAINPH